jgi:hypothetical protein
MHDPSFAKSATSLKQLPMSGAVRELSLWGSRNPSFINDRLAFGATRLQLIYNKDISVTPSSLSIHLLQRTTFHHYTNDLRTKHRF